MFVSQLWTIHHCQEVLKELRIVLFPGIYIVVQLNILCVCVYPTGLCGYLQFLFVCQC
jgi:hypothetical protein